MQTIIHESFITVRLYEKPIILLGNPKRQQLTVELQHQETVIALFVYRGRIATLIFQQVLLWQSNAKSPVRKPKSAGSTATVPVPPNSIRQATPNVHQIFKSDECLCQSSVKLSWLKYRQKVYAQSLRTERSKPSKKLRLSNCFPSSNQ